MRDLKDYKIILGSKDEKILVDEEDYDFLSKYNWNCYSGYARTFRRRAEENKKLRSESMHRMLVKTPKGKVIDHINGNPLDNRKQNLRICTVRQNSCNRKVAKNAATKYLGVCFHKRDNKYQAQIRINKIRTFLGYFDSAQEAAKAYNEAAVVYHGEFARLNKV